MHKNIIKTSSAIPLYSFTSASRDKAWFSVKQFEIYEDVWSE